MRQKAFHLSLWGLRALGNGGGLLTGAGRALTLELLASRGCFKHSLPSETGIAPLSLRSQRTKELKLQMQRFRSFGDNYTPQSVVTALTLSRKLPASSHSTEFQRFPRPWQSKSLLRSPLSFQLTPLPQ